MNKSFSSKFNKYIIILMFIPIILSLFLSVGVIAVFDTTKQDLIKLVILEFFFIALIISLFTAFRNHILTIIIKLVNRLSNTNNVLIKDLDVPLIIISAKGKLVWANDLFLSENSSIRLGTNIYKSLPLLSKFIKNSQEQEYLLLNDKRYRVVVSDINIDDFSLTDIKDDNQNDFIAVYFYDETNLFNYIKAYEDEKMDMALIYVDNYDEVIDQIDEVKKSVLTALIDRKITTYFGKVDGIAKKLDSDKYFVIFRDKYYSQLSKSKFDITELIKEIKVGQEISPTLSIGIGRGCSDYSEAYEYSSNSIDMALSRGGDQVVVRDLDGFTYFGGASERTSKTSRVKARVMAEVISEYILKSDRVIIMGHQLADVDCIGSAIGMYRVCLALGKKANIIINETTISTKPVLKIFKESSDYPTDMFISSEDALLGVTAETLLVVVDTNSPSRTESVDMLKLARNIIVIDHHRQGEDYIKNAKVSYVEPYASSASELVTEIIQHMNVKTKLSSIEAESLYSGIILDTNNFLTKTGVRTFEAAAYLKRCGADVTRVRKLFRDDKISYKAKAEVVREAIIYRDVFAISIFPDIKIDSPTIIGAQAANELLNIDGIKASFVLTKYNGKIYLSARSIDEINVQIICESLGGGGHLSTAGAQFSYTNTASALEELKSAIDKYYE